MSNNYIIFDYDDTLLATHFIYTNQLSFDKLIPKEILDLFNELSIQVLKVLNKATFHGDVAIITNSQAGWIEESSKKLMPAVYEFIISKKIKLISARNEMEKTIPDPTRWKAIIFQKYFELAYQDKNNINVLSFGDNYYDRYALFNLSSSSLNLRKSIKLIENPTIHQLIGELEIIESSFDKIILSNEELDLQINIIGNKNLDKIIVNNKYTTQIIDNHLNDPLIDELYINL